MKYVLRKDALAAGLKRYYTGEPCRRGHIAERFVASRRCIVCSAEDGAKQWVKCPEQKRAYHRQWTRANVAKRLLSFARRRAKQSGVVFDLCDADVHVPTHCPILGIPLEPGIGKMHDGSPQLDRLIPELGYVTNNVIVISKRANQIKSNSHPAELRRIADALEQILCERGLQPHSQNL